MSMKSSAPNEAVRLSDLIAYLSEGETITLLKRPCPRIDVNLVVYMFVLHHTLSM